ncbi:unnamed protein product [Closterium sp. Naga37s-1]|nr:unnamed protein product [Closterium sp. Naga37s-1]
MAGRRRASFPAMSLVKYLLPAYYLRRPKRLFFLSFLLIAGMFLLLRRQHKARQVKALTARVQALHSQKQSMVAEVSLAIRLPKASCLDFSPPLPSTQLLPHLPPFPRPFFPYLPPLPPASFFFLWLLERTRRGAHGTSKEGEEAGEEKQLFEPGRVMREGEEGEEGVEEKREAIREAMAHAWKGYRQYAWGMDELQPCTKTGANHFGGLGLTIVDSLDSLYLMGLMKEFDEAKSWVQEKLFFKHDYDANVFETTIRILGGLLSAYDLSGDPMLLAKAKELAHKLLPAFATPTGIPLAFVNLASGIARSHGWTGRSAMLADLGSTQLEMVALSQRTGDPKYANVVRASPPPSPSSHLSYSKYTNAARTSPPSTHLPSFHAPPLPSFHASSCPSFHTPPVPSFMPPPVPPFALLPFPPF